MQSLEKRFKVAVDDSAAFIEILNAFNIHYKTDFEVSGIEFLDGVEFVFIKFETTTLDNIFLLGYFSDGSFIPRIKTS